MVSQAGVVDYPSEMPTTISFLGFELDVATARQLAVAGLVFAVAVLLMGGGLMLWSGSGSETARWQAKYGALLVMVQNVDLGPQSKIIDVVSLDDLAKIAQRVGCMILYQTHGSTHHYFVQDGEISYRYQVVEQSRKPAITGLQPSFWTQSHDKQIHR